MTILPQNRPVTLILCAVLALGMGAAAGFGIKEVLEAKRVEDYQRSRAEMTRTRLANAGAVNIGDTLIDHVFEDLNQNRVRLSDLVSGVTLISVVAPTCGSCSDQILLISQLASNGPESGLFVFISSANPRYLQEMQAETGLSSPLLYDHRKEWITNYQITDFPFNIIVDENLVIQDIILGGILEQELATIIGGNRRSPVN